MNFIFLLINSVAYTASTGPKPVLGPNCMIPYMVLYSLDPKRGKPL